MYRARAVRREDFKSDQSGFQILQNFQNRMVLVFDSQVAESLHLYVTRTLTPAIQKKCREKVPWL